jgi:hypothetical protein
MVMPTASTLRAASLPRPFYIGAAALMGLLVLGVSLSPAADGFLVRLLLFYAATAGAYALMPFIRRGDIPLVAAWVILIAELTPCFTGRLISPVKVTADAAGVLMATTPIYIARLRQVLQGDIRPGGRRASDRKPD